MGFPILLLLGAARADVNVCKDFYQVKIEKAFKFSSTQSDQEAYFETLRLKLFKYYQNKQIPKWMTVTINGVDLEIDLSHPKLDKKIRLKIKSIEEMEAINTEMRQILGVLKLISGTEKPPVKTAADEAIASSLQEQIDQHFRSWKNINEKDKRELSRFWISKGVLFTESHVASLLTSLDKAFAKGPEGPIDLAAEVGQVEDLKTLDMVKSTFDSFESLIQYSLTSEGSKYSAVELAEKFLLQPEVITLRDQLAESSFQNLDQVRLAAENQRSTILSKPDSALARISDEQKRDYMRQLVKSSLESVLVSAVAIDKAARQIFSKKAGLVMNSAIGQLTSETESSDPNLLGRILNAGKQLAFKYRAMDIVRRQKREAIDELRRNRVLGHSRSDLLAAAEEGFRLAKLDLDSMMAHRQNEKSAHDGLKTIRKNNDELYRFLSQHAYSTEFGPLSSEQVVAKMDADLHSVLQLVKVIDLNDYSLILNGIKKALQTNKESIELLEDQRLLEDDKVKAKLLELRQQAADIEFNYRIVTRESSNPEALSRTRHEVRTLLGLINSIAEKAGTPATSIEQNPDLNEIKSIVSRWLQLYSIPKI